MSASKDLFLRNKRDVVENQQVKQEVKKVVASGVKTTKTFRVSNQTMDLIYQIRLSGGHRDNSEVLEKAIEHYHKYLNK